MSDEDSPPIMPPPMPPQPITKALPKVDPSLELLKQIQVEMRAGFGEMRTDLGLVSSDLTVVKERVRVVELWKVQEEERATRHSFKVKSVSDNDATQDAAIAKIIVDVSEVKEAQALAAVERAKTAAIVKEIRDTVVGVATNKKVIFVGKVLFALAAAYSAAHGLKVLP